MTLSASRPISTPLPAGLPALAKGRDAFECLARNVSVVSARRGDALHGMTVDSLAAICPDPMRVVVAVRRDSRWWSVVTDTGAFAASVLSPGQEAVATWFGSRSRGEGRRQFACVPWHLGPVTGAPLLDGASLTLECLVVAATVVGHQVVVVADLVGAGWLRSQGADLPEHPRCRLRQPRG